MAYTPAKKKSPPPAEFLQAAREVALHQESVDADLTVLDCKVRVYEERSAGGKPVCDIHCGFKSKASTFFNFDLTLWEELAIDMRPVLAEYAHEEWLHVIVDLNSAYDGSYISKKTGELVEKVCIKTAWIILKDGTRIPVHAPMDGPYPPEEEMPPDGDPFAPDDEFSDSGEPPDGGLPDDFFEEE